MVQTLELDVGPEEGAVLYQLARAYQAAGRPEEAKNARERLMGLRKQGGEKKQEVVLGR